MFATMYTDNKYSLLRMTMALRSDHSAVGLMRRILWMLLPSTLAALPPRVAVISPPCRPSPSPPPTAHPLMKRPSSQWVTRTNGLTMTSLRGTQASIKDSPTRSKLYDVKLPVAFVCNSTFSSKEVEQLLRLGLIDLQFRSKVTSMSWRWLSFYFSN